MTLKSLERKVKKQEINIELFKPYEKQRDVINYLLDDNINIVSMVCGRQVGKTTLAMNYALYLIQVPNTKVAFFSPTESQARKIYKKLLDSLPAEFKKQFVKGAGSSGNINIQFANGSQINFGSAAQRDNVRGEDMRYIILDEAAFMKKDFYDTILPFVLTKNNFKIFIATTPRGKNWVHDIFNLGLSSKPEHSKYKSIRFASYDSPLVSKSALDAMTETMSEIMYRQEIDAEFIDSSSCFPKFENILVNQNHDIFKHKSDYYFGGIDVGIVNDRTIFSIADKDGNIVEINIIDEKDSPAIQNKIIEISKKYNFKRILIEQNGVGLVIYQNINRQIKTLETFVTNEKSKSEIINDLMFDIENENFKCIKNDDAIVEFSNFQIITGSTGKLKYMGVGSHDDIVMSVAFVRNAYKQQNKKKTPLVLGYC